MTRRQDKAATPGGPWHGYPEPSPEQEAAYYEARNLHAQEIDTLRRLLARCYQHIDKGRAHPGFPSEFANDILTVLPASLVETL